MAARHLIAALLGAARIQNWLDVRRTDTPAAPPPEGWERFYSKSDGRLYRLDPDGTETEVSGGTPGAHGSTHDDGGSDPLAIDAAAGTGSLRTLGSGSTQAAAGDHAHATGGHDHTSAGGDGGVLTDDEHDSYSEYAERATPSTPAANKGRLYAKDLAGVATPHWLDDGGTEHNLLAATPAVVDLTDQASDPAAASGHSRLYSKTDGLVYFEDEVGTIYDLITGQPHLINSTQHLRGFVGSASNITLDLDSDSYVIDASGGAVTVTLPAITAAADARLYVIAKADSSGNAVTLARSSTNTIDGATTLALDSQYEAVLLAADYGAGMWRRVSHRDPAGGGGGSLTIEEVDGTPSVSGATKLILPNGTVSVSGTEATYTPAGGGGGAPDDATYITETSNGTLSAEVLLSTVVEKAAYASLTAATRAGRLKFPTDGFSVLRDSGSALEPWGPLFPLTTPDDSGFAWINQGGASTDTTKGGIFLSGPATAVYSLRIRKKSAPATPWTKTFCLLAPQMNVRATADVGNCGVLFRESSSGKLHSFSFWPRANGGSGYYSSTKWASATSFSAHYVTINNPPPMPRFVRIGDDGTNRTIELSEDGQHWTLFHSIGQTDFLTANEYGFFVNAPDTTYDIGLLVLSIA